MKSLFQHFITKRVRAFFAFVVTLLGTAQLAYCDTITIDFENLPSLPAQPNNFLAAGPMQTYSIPGIFTISGGVVLGNPTFLPAFTAHGTVPNLYGTTNSADSSLLPTLTLNFPSTAFRVTSVSFILFNGQAVSETYMAFGMAEGITLDPFPIGPLEPASASGFTTVTVMPPTPIKSLSIRPFDAITNGWNFFVDRIVLTGTAVAVPEASSFALLIAGIFTGGFLLNSFNCRLYLRNAFRMRPGSPDTTPH